jgi:hypothetical protein
MMHICKCRTFRGGLRLATFEGPPIDLKDATYFIALHHTQVHKAGGWGAWRQGIFAMLERNFEGAPHDNIPPERVFTVVSHCTCVETVTKPRFDAGSR